MRKKNPLKSWTFPAESAIQLCVWVNILRHLLRTARKAGVSQKRARHTIPGAFRKHKNLLIRWIGILFPSFSTSLTSSNFKGLLPSMSYWRKWCLVVKSITCFYIPAVPMRIPIIIGPSLKAHAIKPEDLSSIPPIHMQTNRINSLPWHCDTHTHTITKRNTVLNKQQANA